MSNVINNKHDISSDLVGQIAGFTSLRDVNLLELSVLKSFFTILDIMQASLMTLDGHGIILKRVDYSEDEPGKITNKAKADKDFLFLCEQIDKINSNYCTKAFDGYYLTLFFLSHNRKLSDYVLIKSDNADFSNKHLQQISGMLEIYRNFKQLLQESQMDELTGLLNRKSFDAIVTKIHDAILPSSEKVKNERRSEESQSRYWLAMLDIDHFKNVNDTYGHVMGDEVLIRVAQTMKETLRDTDFLFRYGGEEFSTISSCDNKNDIKKAIERVRVAVENINIPQIGKITISIGVIEMKKEVFHMTLIERADKALYHSKTNGRNQVSFYEDIEEGKSGMDADEDDYELF